MGDASDFFLKTQLPPHQKRCDFPWVLSPSTAGYSSLSAFTDAIQAQKPFLESLLLEAGAVLFRGFPVNSAEDFNDVVEAFGFEEFPYVGGNAPRVKVVGRVFTANEAPPEQKIAFHHELAQARQYPGKLLFYCEVEPGSGGETPIVESHRVYERMKEKHPEFVARLEEQGLMYMRVFGEEDDPSFPIGRGWKSTFFTDDKELARQRAAAVGMRLEWIEEGVRATMGPGQGVVKQHCGSLHRVARLQERGPREGGDLWRWDAAAGACSGGLRGNTGAGKRGPSLEERRCSGDR